MSSENIATIIQYLPTIFTLLIIALCTLRGLLRGFRKSTILLIHYVVALVVGFVTFFILREKIFVMDLNFVFKLLGNEYAEVHTLYEFVVTFSEQIMPEYASLFRNEIFADYIIADIGLIVNLVLGIVCLVILPILLRFIFYIFYLLLYSERKHKKHVIAEGGEYRRRRLLGMVPQALRGFICATLSVALINSIYFLAAGGNFYDKDTTHKDIDILEALESEFNIDIDLNLAYDALKNSRKTGIGGIYEAIKIDGTPIDYYYIDLFSSVSFESYRITEDNVVEATSILLSNDPEDKDKKMIITLSLRKEITNLTTGLLERVLESNAIQIIDGEIVVDQNILDETIVEIFDETYGESVLLSETLPASIYALVDEVSKGNISISPEIDNYITSDVAEHIKNLDFAHDIGKIARVAVTALGLLPVDDTTGQVDLSKLGDMNYFLSLNPEIVSQLFTEISEISLLSDVLLPVATGIMFNMFEEQIQEFGIDTTSIDLNSIDWRKEIAGLGNIYAKIVDLGLDLEKLLSSEVDSETGETLQMIYLKELAESTEFKENFLVLIDTIMDSDLLSQGMLLAMKGAVSKLEIVDEYGNPNELNKTVDLLKENLNAVDENGNPLYDKEELKADIHTIVNSCLDVLSLVSLFTSDTIDPMQLIKDFDTDALRAALIGETYNETGIVSGGIYNIRLTSGDFNGNGLVDATDGKNAMDSLITSILKTYGVGSGLMTEECINSITDWPAEFNSMLNTIEAIQDMPEILDIDFTADILENFPTTIEYSDIDELTEALSESKLLSDIITNIMTSVLETPELEEIITVPDDVLWMDSFDSNGNVSSRGEMNALLKVFVLFNQEDNKISLSDSDSILNGFANLEEEDVNIITDSAIIVGSLDSLVGSLLTEDGELNVDVTWENTYDSNGNLISKGELNSICDILKLSLLKDPETEQIDIARLSDVNELADLIKYDEINLKDDYTDVVTIAQSKLVMSIISDKIGELSDGSMSIIIPDKLVTDVNENAWENWSYDEDKKYEKGEFANLITVLYNAKKHVLTIKDEYNQNKYSKLDTENMLEGVIGMPNQDCVTDSLILYATISNEIMKLENDDVIKVRSVAKVADPTLNDNIILKKDEVNKVLSTIKQLEMTSFDGIDAQLIINKLSAEDDSLREGLCNSNILNITTVYNIINSSNGHIEFAGYDAYNDETKDYNSVWYPTSTETWHECELNKVLISVAELELKVNDSGSIELKPKEILYKLNDDALSDEPLSGVYYAMRASVKKIEVIYQSYVMRHTITMHIEDYEKTTENPDGVILIRSEAYNTTETDVVDSSEVLGLINFLENNGLDFDAGIKTQDVLDIMSDEAERQNICNSNILNITVVDKLIESDPSEQNIKFGVEYKNINNSSWYPGNGISTTDSELYKVLTSVNALEITADSAGNIKVEPEDMLYKLNDNISTSDSTKKIDVVYRSYVMRHTITMHIENYEKTTENPDGKVLIRDNAYDTTETDIVSSSEILILVNFLEDNGLSIEEGISTQKVLDIVKEDEQRINICNSNILNITVVDKVITSDPNEENLKFGTVYINVNNDAWYPGVATPTTNSELYKMLTSIVELDIKVSGENFDFDPSDILYKMNDSSNINIGSKKADVVLSSDVMAQTITHKVKNADGISVREEEAFDLNGNIKSIEVIVLVDFLEGEDGEADDISIDSTITAKNILDRITLKEVSGVVVNKDLVLDNINLIVSSNLLNITIVEKLAIAQGLYYPNAYIDNDDNIKTDFEEWYKSDGELYRFLKSFAELNDGTSIVVNGNDININQNLIIDSLILHARTTNNADDLRIDVVYQSHIFEKTIGKHVLEAIDVPNKDSEGNSIIVELVIDGQTDKVVSKEEVKNMIKAFDAIDFKFGDDLHGDHDPLAAMTLTSISEKIDDILSSAILHHIISDRLIKQDCIADNSTVEGIVPLTYYTQNSEIEPTRKVVYGYALGEEIYLANDEGNLTSNEVYYIVKSEVVKAIDGLSQIYSDDKKISDGFVLSVSMLFDRSEDDINKISNSTLLSYMFSHMLITEGITKYSISYKYYEYLGFITHSDVNYYEAYIKEIDLIEYEFDNYQSFHDYTFSLEEVGILLRDLQTVEI